jgi:hypothetical protein
MTASPYPFLRKSAVSGGAISLLVATFILATIAYNRRSMPEIPLPDGANDAVEYYGPLSFYKHIAFDPPQPHPIQEIIDFYAEWALRNDWTRAGPEIERWSTDGWQSFFDGTRGNRTVNQYLAHWASPGQEWSLRVALVYSPPLSDSDTTRREAMVILERYQPIRNGYTLEDGSQHNQGRQS